MIPHGRLVFGEGLLLDCLQTSQAKLKRGRLPIPRQRYGHSPEDRRLAPTAFDKDAPGVANSVPLDQRVWFESDTQAEAAGYSVRGG